jgi:transcriptional regulator with XRE-family HTH domain
MDANSTAVPAREPRWWDAPDMRVALARHDVAAVYRWLQRHGWSQTQIGAAVGQSQGEVSEVISGARRIQAYDLLVRIAEAFGIPRGHMGLAYAETTPLGRRDDEEDNAVLRRQFLGAAAGLVVGAAVEGLDRWLPQAPDPTAPVPARVGAADVAQVRAVTEHLRLLDQRYGGGAVVDAARGFLGWASGMLHSRYDEATQRTLPISLADLSSLVGWAFHDAGAQEQARRHLTQALVYARDAEAHGLVAAVLYRLGRLSLHRERPLDALRLFQLGQIAAQDADDPAEVARLHANEAWAYAQMGQHQQMHSALARAQDEAERVAPATAQPWTAVFFAPGDFTGHCALVHGVLARATSDARSAARHAVHAAELAKTALAASTSERPARSQVFDRIVLAAALLRAGEPAAGISNGHEAVILTTTLRSARATARLADIADAASAFGHEPGAVELRQRIADTAA